MSTQSSIVNYYAERAAEYERIYQKPERPADLRELRGFVELAVAGAHVFEVACGTGSPPFPIPRPDPAGNASPAS